ncbi:aminotransferase class I/II-fold pyridoxal phosphate-dependent enzyme [candidate division KSB1 bacterium]|nr:aminotransferase class I/II-fold pyridoxal phosphate-dependent enzyme [Candidatus Aminicenantes bacterium]RQW03597.1 MAG: aminotransferase class I/II-fold pyridoxal phosphate-dependent enzyme [candidate division KSB1 bacterium]
MDVFKKCYDFTRADEAKKIGLYPYFTEIEKVEGNYVWVKSKKILMVGSNNYLGLFDDPRIKEGAIAAVKHYGSSTCGSRFLNGTYSLHVELENKLAKFMGKEEALTFSTGMQTNLGTISALASRNDIIILDRMVHASIMDAVRLSYAHVAKYKHNDMKDLEDKLAHQPEDKGKLIIVDGVFSMEGDLANLPKIVKLAKKYNARLMVDDAHGVGVMGEKGQGTSEHFGLIDGVDLVMTTFSKSFASLGGFVVGDSKIIQYIKHHARALIFSASITPAALGAADKALEIIQNEPERRRRLWEITRIMNKELTAMGYHTGNTETPIIPVFINDLDKTFMLWMFLRDFGIFTNPVIAPAVPPEDSLIRTSFTATHTNSDLDFILEGFRQGGKTLGLI